MDLIISILTQFKMKNIYIKKIEHNKYLYFVFFLIIVGLIQNNFSQGTHFKNFKNLIE